MKQTASAKCLVKLPVFSIEPDMSALSGQNVCSRVFFFIYIKLSSPVYGKYTGFRFVYVYLISDFVFFSFKNSLIYPVESNDRGFFSNSRCGIRHRDIFYTVLWSFFVKIFK